MTTARREIQPADEATIGMAADGRGFIRFERQLPYPIEEVWPAIVDPARMSDWLAYRAEIDPRLGGRLALWLGGRNEPGGSAGSSSVQESVISRFEPPHVLEAHSDDWGTMLFVLVPDGEGTRFIFVHTLTPEEGRKYSIVAGWHLRMELLEGSCKGRPADWAALDASRNERGIVGRIAEIYRHYANQPD